MSSVSLCKIIPFQTSALDGAQLAVANQSDHIPFVINRIYYLTDVKGSQARGNHANIRNQQVIVPLQGSFLVTVNDGEEEKTFFLSSSSEGLYLPNLTWRSVYGFSVDAICLVICSEKYDSADYVKDFEVFKIEKNKSISKS